MQKGEVDIDFFERVTEMVTFNNNIAIARANETLHSTGRMQNAGKKSKREYINSWRKTEKRWQLVAAQATIIAVEQL